MPYPKMKSENYRAIGGMNTKASQYLTDETEFLNLRNVDFRTIGALSSFAGSTQYSSVASTSPITGIQSFSRGINLGFTFRSGVTQVALSVTNTLLATDAFHVCDVSGGTFQNVFNYVVPNNVDRTSYAYLNYQFGANSWDHWTYTGDTYSSKSWLFGLPPVFGGLQVITGGSGIAGGISGPYLMHMAYVREDGLIGPATSTTYPFFGASIVAFTLLPANSSVGATFSLYQSFMTGQSQGSWGISGVQVWVQIGSGAPQGLSFLLPLSGGGFTLTQGFSLIWTGAQPRSAVEFISSFLYGFELGGYGKLVFSSVSPPARPPTYYGESFAQFVGWSNPVHFYRQPQLQESFFNQLFVAIGSRVLFSLPGEPEIFDRSNFFDVALDLTGDVTAMRAYFTQLIICKTSRVYSLSGTGPSTYVLNLVSSEYGCLSKNAACVWNQTFWFLDEKGIMEFNGGNVIPTSNKMEDIFNRMNVDAAEREAVMIHVKDRNEVWTAIPIDGSTTNNIIVVYDYLSNAWTTRTCPPGGINALESLALGDVKETVYFGTSSGLIGTFGSSLMGDNGQAFTSIIKSRFIAPLGDSTTNMFRRLFVDANVPVGATYAMLVNLYADHGVTPAYSVTMILTAFQNRIDFGVPAKSLAVEFIYAGMTALQFNGFTIESRFQRAV